MNDLLVTANPTDHGAVSNFDSVNNATNGLPGIDGAADAVAALANGDFVEASVNGVSGAIDVVGMIIDPIAGVSSMVANFFMEHCGPLQDWLDEMLGDPAVITAGANTWTNIGNHLGDVALEYGRLVTSDLGEFSGLAMESYRSYALFVENTCFELGRVGHAVSAGIDIAGRLLAGVRDFVQALVSDLIGAAISALAKTAATLGLAAPWAGTGLVLKAKKIIEDCRTFMKGLATSLDEMGELIGIISPVMETATKSLSKYIVKGASIPVESLITLSTSMAKGATSGNQDAF